MKARSMIIPLVLITIILGSGTFVTAVIIATHTPAWFNQSEWYAFGWILFVLLQVSAPTLQVLYRRKKTDSDFMEKLQWHAYLAVGVLSMLFFTTISLEILSWPIASFIEPSQEPLFDGIWIALMLLISMGLTLKGILQAAKAPPVKHIQVKISRLPKALHGFRIAQISDLHVSSLLGRRYTQKVVDRVNATNPDIIAMTGDFVDGSVEDLRYRAEPLADLKAKYGRFFITGNHEYYYNALSWIAEHRRFGSIVLLNEHHLLSHDGAQLAVVGLTDRFGGNFVVGHKPDIKKAIAGIPEGAIKILLAHQPGCYDEALAAGIDLQLSGHTHGGQFLPWQYVVKLIHRYANGLYKHGSMWIYVNPGTGFWGPPLRTSVPPEVTLIELEADILS